MNTTINTALYLGEEHKCAVDVGIARLTALAYVKLWEKSAEIREVTQLWVSVTEHSWNCGCC